MQIQALDQLIPTLKPYFTTKAPFQIPTGGREFIVKIAPWVIIAVAVLSVFGLFGILSALGLGTAMLGAYGVYVPQSGLYVAMAWASLIIGIINIILLFMAFPGLKSHQESGWRYIYYTEALAIASAIVSFVGGFNGGSLLGGALGVIIGLYILFQVRDYYTGKAKLSEAPAAATPAVEAKSDSAK